MKFIIFKILFFYSFPLKAYDQNIDSMPSVYNHIFKAKIVRIDTTYLVSDEFLQQTKSGLFRDKVVVVKIKITKKIAGKFNRRINLVIMNLSLNEHVCLFEFKKGRSYIIHAYISRYSNLLIKKKLRNPFYDLDCYKMPY